MCKYQCWLIKLLYDIRHGKSLTRSGYTQQRLKLITFLKTLYQFFYCLRLISGGLVFRYQFKMIHENLLKILYTNCHLLMAAPRLKPAYIISNISSYIKQKHDSCPSLFIPRTTTIIHQLTILFTLYTSPLRHHFILHQTYIIASLIINSYHNILKASIESQHINFICL